MRTTLEKSNKVRGRVPRKQGLKLLGYSMRWKPCGRPRASSTKTRIETSKSSHRYQSYIVRGRVPRKQGLKLNRASFLGTTFDVRGRVPRKQGLKLNESDELHPLPWCPRASSTKTRIETVQCENYTFNRIVRGRVPRKQGLKLICTDRPACRFAVRGRVPRKQGLKLKSIYV